MERRLFLSPQLAQPWLVCLFVMVATCFFTPALFAQSGVSPAVADETSGPPIQRRPVVRDAQMHKQQAAHKRAADLAPALPFRQPQIGPVIKRSFADDVDRRTTAFIPQAGVLDHLTPLTSPKGEERWIRVDLSEQMVVAYERDKPVRAFIISSGLPGTPTVVGEYRIRTKVKEQTMSGENYSLPGVKWVQYFFEDYSFHGTYWHNDFGRPKSHGCLNMTNTDAKWLFDWAGPTWDGKTIWYKSSKDNPGTLVVITE
jgi:lipoprotein-anchoring transpeptidase ErfK/SrfK